VGVGVVGSFAFKVLVDSTGRRRLPDGVSSVRLMVSRRSKSSSTAPLADFGALPEAIMNFSIPFNNIATNIMKTYRVAPCLSSFC
jgi:hypothetical protein